METLTQKEYNKVYNIGEDTITKEKRLDDRKEINDIPKKSTNLLMGIIVLLVAAVAFLVGWLTADINIVIK